jgi:hypothetical protein
MSSDRDPRTSASGPGGPALKTALLNRSVIRKPWSAFRRWQLHRSYVHRRERYARLAAARGLVYREEDVKSEVRARLAARGSRPQRREIGDVHTFAFIPRFGWQASLYSDLRELGPVSEFDYSALGYHWEEFWDRHARGAGRRHEMNSRVLPAIREAQARRSIDWVFVYASGLEIETEVVRQITRELGLPVVNMCLDDKQSWEGPVIGGQRLGQIDIAPAFDLSWTSARVACEWYLVEGARPIYLPEGFDLATYRPSPDVTQDIPVSFIGAAYGYRPDVIRFLRRHDVPIQVFGTGWESGAISNSEAVSVINRSRLSLGMGGIGYSEMLTNVKARDFEIPAVGTAAYLTSFNPDLAQHFIIGKEVLCYRNRDEMLELLRYCLARPEETSAIARRGKMRCLAEHRWRNRFERICCILGILPEE